MIGTVPVAQTLRLCCPDCAAQLEDRADGPVFWCDQCRRVVSAIYFVAALMATAADRKGPR